MKNFLVLFLLMLAASALYVHFRVDSDIKVEVVNLGNNLKLQLKGSDKPIQPPKGINVEKLTLNLDNRAVTIEIVDVNLENSKFSVGISAPSVFKNTKNASQYSGLSLREYGKLGHYQVIQSGGFLSSWSPPYPLGYVKIKGNEINRSHSSWLTQGVFCTNGNEFEINRFKNNEQFNSWSSCIQAGPIVALEGKIVLDTKRNTGYVTKEPHRQSFICKRSDGDLIMGIAENVRLETLSKILVQPKEDKGIGCVDVVALNGRDVAGILLNTVGQEIGNVDVPLPNAIIIK